jgi:putative DNA primase/helicase
LLVGVFNESVFSGGSRAPSAFVAIAAAVTACVRPALSIAPAFGFSAYKQGSGKTTAAKVAALLATGRDPPVLAPTDDENEFKKALLSILIAGDPCVLIDNVAKPVDSAALCAALTSAIYSDRVLGVSQKISAPTLVTWLLTGNALEFVGDLTSRVLLSVLDPECENPEARPFRRNLGDYVLAHRGELVRAALTIPLAYNAAGSPVVNASRSRFAEWDGMVRRPLLWLGCADPLDTQANLRASDPVRETLVALLAAWRDVFGTDEKTVADAIAAAYKVGQSAASQLLEALQGAAGERGGEINARRLGKYLARNVRRIEAGNRFEAAGPDLTTRRQKYRVASVTSVISVSANPSREHGEGNCTGTSGTNAENAGNAGGCIRCRGEGCSWCTQK